jgi:hypothetical protein
MARQRGGAFGDVLSGYMPLISFILLIIGLGVFGAGLTSKDPDHNKRNTMTNTGWTIMIVGLIASIASAFYMFTVR